MNRHHPYGGPYDGPRRGGPGGNIGPGPDRSHRFDRGGAPRGRAFGRGRGGSHQSSYGGYGNTAPYDQGPPQGDMGGYNYYQSTPQDQFYQNGEYAAPGPGQYDAPGSASGFEQGYGYEDQNYSQGGNHGRSQKRPQRRERDDKVHDSIIEERIQRERPCRTLFIRNIKYETSSDDVRRLFEEHGDIKTFFDLIANRGMVFVTYYDLRAAERARERLQGSEISGRPIDVHYSLPRDDHGKGADRQREQELQGTLLVTLRNSVTNQPIDDEEVRRKFQQFGDVKSVRPVGDRPDQRYVEFYDTRACEEAHDRLRHQGLQDGVMDIVFAYTGTDESQAGSPRREREDRGGFDRQRDWEEPHSRGRRGGRGGRGRGRGHGGNDWGDRRDFNNDRERNRSYEDEFGRSQRGGDYGSRYGNRNGPGGFSGSGPSGPGYSAPPTSGYGQSPAALAEAADERERLEQAKKVQQLLAALKQPSAAGGAAAAAAPPAPPPAPPTMPQLPPAPAPATNPYYNQATAPMPPQAPTYPPNPHPVQTTNPYASLSSQSSTTPQPLQAAPSAPMAGLPPNILALLQQSTQAQQPSAQSSAPPPMPPYSMPPASAMIGAQQGQQPQQLPMPGMPPPTPSQPGYQQLMAYLQSQKR
ncbi:hypothetical protein BD414DRAFT_523522 [Trametes punicea]|nr:hypothetical protein BD414DRAFT_523522 [Trametes punicea]